MALYVAQNKVEMTTLGRLAGGVIAYSVTDAAWIFTIATDEGVSHWTALTGDRKFELRTLIERDARLVAVLPEPWSIELIPDTITDGTTLRIAKGQAFRSAEGFGFAVMPIGAGDNEAALAVTIGGTITEWGYRATVAFISKWRIVTGDQKDPFVICEVDSPGWGS